MKLLLFSDVHTNRRHCQNLIEMSKKADIVISAGDIGSLRMNLKKTIGWLSEIEKPTIMVPGNAESFDELKNACTIWPSATVLHGTGIERKGVLFFGIGGGIPVTPFGTWSYDFSEKEAEALLKDCPEDCVLISHSPPKGILDISSRGRHLGSKTIREVIEKKIPQLVVCGHIHESSGKTEILGKTTIVNAGPHGVYFEIKI